MERYYRQLLTEDRNRNNINLEMFEEDIEAITVKGIREALRRMKNSKVPEPGGILIELVKYGLSSLL